MKLTMNVGALSSALSAVHGTIGRNKDLPILSNVRISARTDHVSLTTTDLDAQSMVEMECKRIEAEGEIATEIKALHGVISRLPDKADVTLELEAAQLTVQSGRTKVKLQTLPADGWVNIRESQTDEAQEPVHFDRIELGEALTRIQHAMNSGALRPVLKGVYFEPDENGDPQIHLTATDGYRLATYRLEQAGDFKPVIVPRNAVAEVIKMCARYSERDVTFTLYGPASYPSLAEFRCGVETYTTKLVEGQFVNWRAVLPPNIKCKAAVNPEDLERAVGLVTSIAQSEKTPGVALRFRGEEVLIQLDHERLEAATPCHVKSEIEGDDEEVVVVCNARFLSEALSRSEKDGTKVRIGASDAAPFLISSDGSPFQQVVTQIRSAMRANVQLPSGSTVASEGAAA